MTRFGSTDAIWADAKIRIFASAGDPTIGRKREWIGGRNVCVCNCVCDEPFPSSSHRTPLGTRRRISIHAANISGVIWISSKLDSPWLSSSSDDVTCTFINLLKQTYTNASFGIPCDSLVGTLPAWSSGINNGGGNLSFILDGKNEVSR